MNFKPERAVYFSGEIDTHTAMELMISMTKLHAADPKSPITMFIASSGESVSDTFAIYDYVMRALKPKLETVALGEVNSMAALLFLMGEQRHIGELAVMRFHRFSMGVSASLTSQKASQTREDLERSEKKYVNAIVNITRGKITRNAVKLGLAHKIL